MCISLIVETALFGPSMKPFVLIKFDPVFLASRILLAFDCQVSNPVCMRHGYTTHFEVFGVY